LSVPGWWGVAGRSGFAGRPAGSRRSGEGLGDVEPAVGHGAGGSQDQVVAVSSLRDQQTEIQGRPVDPVGRVRRPECPQCTVGGSEFQPDRYRRLVEPSGRERVAQCAVAEVGDVAEAGGGWGDYAQRFGHVEPVRPGLHQSGGGQ
jgi:hypothetical protein